MQTNTALQSEAVARKDRQLIDALRRSKVYRQYEKVFSEATGLPLALRPTESFDLPFHGNKYENPFCAFLAGQKSACAFCLQSQAKFSKQVGPGPCTVRCPFGLTETRVPVRLGERLIGFLQVGQVFTQPPKVATFRKAVRHLFPDGAVPEKKLLELWKRTPVVPPEKYQATVQLLKFFAKQLSTISNEIVTEQSTAEPPLVSRARAFITANKTEALSLAAVAKAAGASVFHFCKAFKKGTGLKFTDYVARVRLQEAKELLPNRNKRVSEIAYDVGFQSLTQFNRTFRRVFGQSPTEYRENLFAGRPAMKMA